VLQKAREVWRDGAAFPDPGLPAARVDRGRSRGGTGIASSAGPCH